MASRHLRQLPRKDAPRQILRPAFLPAPQRYWPRPGSIIKGTIHSAFMGPVREPGSSVPPSRAERQDWAEEMNVRDDSVKRMLTLFKRRTSPKPPLIFRRLVVRESGARGSNTDNNIPGLASSDSRQWGAAKLRFLQYVNRNSQLWWSNQSAQEAIVLGKNGVQPSGEPVAGDGTNPLSPPELSSAILADLSQSEVVQMTSQLASLSASVNDMRATPAKLFEQSDVSANQVSIVSKALQCLLPVPD